MYSLACRNVFLPGGTQSTITVTGLDENIGAAVDIVEDLIFNAVPDTAILSALKADILKDRADSKLSQSACFSALQSYIFYGPEYISKTTLPNEKVLSLTSDELLGAVRDLFSKKHEVMYYGPAEEAAVENMLAEHHTIEDNPQPLVKERPARRQVAESEVFIAPYDANQFYYIQYSDRGEKFDVANDPAISMYNSYFGSGMNAIVFQEMREARGLAYSASAFLSSPPYADDDYMFYAFIASQNDKLKDAVEAFDQIINNMPESEEAFQVAKTSILSRLRTSRTTGMGVLNKYVALRDLGLSEDRDKAIFEKIQNYNNKYAFYTSLSKNAYSFSSSSDINNLITKMYNDRNTGLKSDPNWVEKHPNWNKAILLPVGEIKSATSSSTNSTPIALIHEMGVTSTRLKRGTSSDPIKMRVIYAHFND